MGNPLKIKIIILSISVSLLGSIALIKNNFYTTPIYKRWSDLEWSDFNGISAPFTDFEASIWSDIYLEFDSISNTYKAYSAQNNQKSWKKYEDEDSDYLLNHEQYHFNIAELYARKINMYINQNPRQDLKFYEKELEALKIKEQEMQALYDNESEHSISKVNQSIWEYKIDSLMQYYSNQTGFITDFYSGAKAYFPQIPKFEKKIDSIDGYSYRDFSLNKYNNEPIFNFFSIFNS